MYFAETMKTNGLCKIGGYQDKGVLYGCISVAKKKTNVFDGNATGFWA